jgi:hypothetical protein
VFIASYLDAVVDQARLLVGEQVPIKPALPTVSPEERAMRADNRALLAELQGVGAEAAWRDAVAAWSVIGSTIWRARAEARAGDLEAAERTLDAIGADEPARSWARQRGTGNRG